MHKFDRDECDGHLRRRLRREARQSRPVFSDSLHARLVSAIVPQRAESSRVWRTGRGRLVSWTLALAASIAAAVTLALFLRVTPSPTENLAASNSSGPGSTGVRQQAKNEEPPPRNQIEGATANNGTSDIDAVSEDLASSATGIGDWVLSVADDNRWAGLDRDAQAGLAAVTGPLPFDITLSLAEE